MIDPFGTRFTFSSGYTKYLFSEKEKKRIYLSCSIKICKNIVIIKTITIPKIYTVVFKFSLNVKRKTS